MMYIDGKTIHEDTLVEILCKYYDEGSIFYTPFVQCFLVKEIIDQGFYRFKNRKENKGVEVTEEDYIKTFMKEHDARFLEGTYS